MIACSLFSDLFKKETPKSASTVAPPDNGSAAEAESVPDLPKAPELCQSSSEEVKVHLKTNTNTSLIIMR